MHCCGQCRQGGDAQILHVRARHSVTGSAGDSSTAITTCGSRIGCPRRPWRTAAAAPPAAGAPRGYPPASQPAPSAPQRTSPCLRQFPSQLRGDRVTVTARDVGISLGEGQRRWPTSGATFHATQCNIKRDRGTDHVLSAARTGPRRWILSWQANAHLKRRQAHGLQDWSVVEAHIAPARVHLHKNRMNACVATGSVRWLQGAELPSRWYAPILQAQPGPA